MYDLVVLGGGPGGLNVASAAARVGARVALVEKSHLGGECTHTACVPSKALIQAARVVHQVRAAGEYGVRTPAPEVDFAAVMARVRRVVADFAGSDSGDSLRARGIEVFRGSPAFEAYDTVVVDGQEHLVSQRFVIATGSRPAVPNVPGLAGAGYLDNRTVWDLDELPLALIILGAGPTGMEFAQAFARLGSDVTVLADSEQVLPREDVEISERVRAALAAEGITIRTGVEVTRVARRDGQTACSYRRTSTGETGEVAGTHLIVATGRRPNIEGLNLDAAGIHADPVHGIEVDEYLQTRSTRTYAIGDVLQDHLFTHAAEREAAVAFQNAVLRLPKKIDYSALPWAVFVDPEVATVGLSESAARARRPEVRAFRAEFADLDRARIDGRTQGFAKVVVLPSGKILGATILGEQAALILQEFVLAMENGLALQDIAATTHTYPTYAGLARKLANEFLATRHEGGLVQTAIRWFYGYRPKVADGGATEPEIHAEAH
ncbi:MAG: dihydrolipoyl dehydrogenase family protein [Planctomycetaceae bacterium]